MPRWTKLLTLFSYGLNIPALFIWLTVWLALAGEPLGNQLSTYVKTNFTVMELLIMWVALPSIALVLGLAGFVIGENKKINIGSAILSGLLLFSLILASTVLET